MSYLATFKYSSVECFITFSKAEAIKSRIIFVSWLYTLKAFEIASPLLPKNPLSCCSTKIDGIFQNDFRILLAVDARNEPALRLYDRLGFEVTGTAEAWF